jgi:hypothetical protein
MVISSRGLTTAPSLQAQRHIPLRRGDSYCGGCRDNESDPHFQLRGLISGCIWRFHVTTIAAPGPRHVGGLEAPDDLGAGVKRNRSTLPRP